MAKTVTNKEILTFIFSQPKNREVKMDESSYKMGGCGCVMVQYAKSEGFEKPMAGHTVINSDATNDNLNLQSPIGAFVPDNLWRKENLTYKDIQGYLKKQDWVKELIDIV